MKIPNTTGLAEKNALVLAAGKQRARFYSIKDNEIREIDNIEIETPKYSDREGFLMRAGSGKVYGAGAPYENKKQKVETDFLKELGKKLPKHLSKFKEVYIFCPNYMHKMIESKFPKNTGKMIQAVYFGNIVDTNPLKFAEKIANSGKRKVSVRSVRNAPPEAKKILRKPQAGRKK